MNDLKYQRSSFAYQIDSSNTNKLYCESKPNTHCLLFTRFNCCINFLCQIFPFPTHFWLVYSYCVLESGKEREFVICFHLNALSIGIDKYKIVYYMPSLMAQPL